MSTKTKTTLTKLTKLTALCLGGLTFSTVQANAGLIAPNGVTASSELNFPSEDRRAFHVIDGSGLTGGFHTNANYTDTSPGPGAGQGIYWLASSPTGQSIAFTFNTAQNFDSMHLWNYSEWTDLGRGIQNTDVKFYFGGTLVNTINNVSIAQAPTGAYTGASPTYAGNDYSFGSTILADKIEFANMSNWGGDLIGLSEVRFNIAPVPEPATAVFGVALLGLGLVRRRRSA